MRTTKTRRPVPALVLSLLLPVTGGVPSPARSAPQQVRDGDAAGSGAEPQAARAEAILEAMVQRYRGLRSYEDQLETTTVMEPEEPQDFPMAGLGEITFTASLAFARPNRIALSGEHLGLYCDGTHQWTVMPSLQQYIKREAGSTIDLSALGQWGQVGGSPLSLLSHPVASILVGPGSWREVFPGLELRGVTEEARDGRVLDRIEGTFGYEQMGAEWRAPVSLLVGRETGLLHEVVVDMTAAANAMADQMKELAGEDDPEAGEMFAGQATRYRKLESRLIVRNAAPDLEIPAERFAFDAEEDHEQVEEFGVSGFGEDQQRLVGHPAPEFTATDLAGEKLNLADLRGRVVILDFWAIWCSPCVAALPHVQKLANRFAADPVTVLGVNRDAPGSEKRVARFLEKKGVTFRQVMDADGAIAEKYMVTGIPCTVLIDAGGVVQLVQTGFAPGHEDDLAEDIGRVIAGERLFDPDEVAALAAEGGGAAGQPEAIAIEEVAADRLVEAGRVGGVFGGSPGQRFDLDGDGRDELVVPGVQGRLVVVASDGSGVRRVRLEGLRSNATVTAIEPVSVSGAAHWLISSTTWGISGSTSVVVSLHDEQGKRLWAYRPELPVGGGATALIASGDLDGDRRLEFAVGLNSFVYQRASARFSMSSSDMAAHLVVLDVEGRVVAQRRVGSSISLVWVAAPPVPGEPASILCSVESTLRRYRLGPPGAAAPGG